MTKEEIVKLLDLKPHIEGGFFREVYRSNMEFPKIGLPEESFRAEKYRAGTSIYFLMTPESPSSMHKISADETWHFYASNGSGSHIELLVVSPEGEGRLVKLGNDFAAGCRPQFTVPANHWMGARAVSESGSDCWTLSGATVAPSFEFEDFKKGDAEEIAALCPEFSDLIKILG